MNLLFYKAFTFAILNGKLLAIAFLAAGSINQALGQAGGIINGFGLIGCFAGIVYAGYNAMQGHTDKIKYGLLGSALCGLAWIIATQMFAAGGQETSIQLQQPN
jgi:hypothetical protein